VLGGSNIDFVSLGVLGGSIIEFESLGVLAIHIAPGIVARAGGVCCQHRG
jgi:hypothetical protein